MKIYGYARVSSKEQNLDRQISKLEEFGCDLILSDKASGKNTNREEYQLLKKVVREGDSVVFCELDRLGRNYDDIKNEIQYFDNVGVVVEFLDFPMPKTGDKTMDKMLRDQVVNTLAYVAQKEREKIKTRQAEGIAIAKEQGKHLGRPQAEYPNNWNEVYGQWKSGDIKAVQAIELLELKKTTFYKLVKQYENK